MTSNIINEVRAIGMLNILQKVMSGQSITVACKGSGYSVSTFKRMLQEDDSIARELITDQRRIIEGQFNAVTFARQRLLSNLLKDAEDPKMPIPVKLALEDRLHDMELSLGSSLGVGTGDGKDDAKAYAAGMNLRPARARITQTKTVVEFDTDPTSEIEQPIDAIPLPDVIPNKRESVEDQSNS